MDPLENLVQVSVLSSPFYFYVHIFIGLLLSFFQKEKPYNMCIFMYTREAQQFIKKRCETVVDMEGKNIPRNKTARNTKMILSTWIIYNKGKKFHVENHFYRLLP